MSETLAGQQTLYPLEFSVAGTPMSLGASSRSRERWKTAVKQAARDRVRATDELGFLDRRPFALTIYYFAKMPMQGDVDNIVKPIMDALIHVAYMDDQDVERIVVQRFEPELPRNFPNPTVQLAAALRETPPVVYVRVDDDLRWRMSS